MKFPPLLPGKPARLDSRRRGNGGNKAGLAGGPTWELGSAGTGEEKRKMTGKEKGETGKFVSGDDIRLFEKEEMQGICRATQQPAFSNSLKGSPGRGSPNIFI